MEIDVVKLKELIEDYFNLAGLEDLCFSLQINWDRLAGSTLPAKTRSLIVYSQQNGRVDDLIKELREKRPNVDWSIIIIIADQGESSSLPDSPSESNDTINRTTKVRKKPHTHIGIIIIINSIFVAALSFLTPWLIGKYLKSFTLCRSDSFNAVSLSIIIILTSHLFWHVLSPALDLAAAKSKGTIKVFGFEISIESVQSVIDPFHPWILSDRIFWGTFIVGLVIALLSLTSIIRQEAAPKLAHFSVLIDGDSQSVHLPISKPLQLQPGQTATIEAVTGELKGVNCEWESLNGVITETDGCKVTYVAPQIKDIDSLEVNIASKCSAYVLISALIVNIP